MPRTPEEQKKWELQCYGCTAEQLEHGFSEIIMGDKDTVAMSILSDAQELVDMLDADFERKEQIRQYINKAKYFIMRDKRNGDR